MNKYISDAKDRVSLEVSKIINDANTSTVDLINCMTNVSDDVKTIINKVSVMGDMITDLRVLNGTAKSITPISELPVVSNSGIYIKDNEIGLDLSSQVSKEVDANKATIISTLPYSLYNKDVSTELSLLFKSNTSTKVLFDTSGFSFSVVLPFSDMEQINCIDIKLDLDTEIYPIINSIKYVDQNNLIKDTPILDTQDKSIDLDENRVKDNLYSIHISPVISNQIIIEFVSKTGSSVTFNSIKPKYNKREISGEAIFGPYVSQEPILKLAVDSDSITSGVSLYISGDKENWRPLTNSSSFGSEKKILSFNTINKDSQKLTEDLYRVYIKVAIQSSKITNETSLVSVYDTYREDGIISNDIMASIPNNLLSAYRIKNSDYLYGKYSYNNTCNISNLDLNKIEQIDVEGVPKVMGITTTKYSVSNNYDSSLGVASVGCELKSLRLPSNSVVDAKGFDVANSKLVDIYTLPINKRINIKQKDNLCFTLNVKEDVYTIISKDTRKYLTLDLTTPFIKNSSAALIQVPNEDILIRDSLGNTLVTITKDKLLQLDNVYFLNLVGTLYTPLLVSGLVYSPYYPIKELNDGEYALLEGKIVATSGVLFDVQGYELLRSEVTCTRVVNYTNGNYIKRLDDSYTYYHEQELDVSEPVTVLKLDSVSIAKGSLVIEDSSYKQNNYINYKVTKLSASRQDNTSPYDLVVELSNNTVLNSDCYIDIIADKSSAVITKIDDRNYKISNPTDTTVKVSIIYKGMNISHEYIDLKGILGWGNSGYVKGDIGEKEQPLNKSISCDGAIGEVIMGLNKVSSDSICTVTVELDNGKKYSMSKTYTDFNKPVFQGKPNVYLEWIDIETNQTTNDNNLMLAVIDANEVLNKDIYALELVNSKDTNQIIKKLSVNNTISLLDENPNKTIILNDDGSVSFCLSKLDTGNGESNNNQAPVSNTPTSTISCNISNSISNFEDKDIYTEGAGFATSKTTLLTVYDINKGNNISLGITGNYGNSDTQTHQLNDITIYIDRSYPGDFIQYGLRMEYSGTDCIPVRYTLPIDYTGSTGLQHYSSIDNTICLTNSNSSSNSVATYIAPVNYTCSYTTAPDIASFLIDSFDNDQAYIKLTVTSQLKSDMSETQQIYTNYSKKGIIDLLNNIDLQNFLEKYNIEISITNNSKVTVVGNIPENDKYLAKALEINLARLGTFKSIDGDYQSTIMISKDGKSLYGCLGIHED